MRKLSKMLAVTCLVLQVMACAPGSDGPLSVLSAPSQAELSQLNQSKIPAANTAFAFDVLEKLNAAQTEPKNIFVSPLSISIALSMLHQGASGVTREEIASALNYSGLDEAMINTGNLTLRKRLMNTGDGVEILVANALWGRQGILFAPSFLSANLEFYDAQLQSLDFAKPEALKTINQWASDNTRGKIPSVLDEIDPQSILLLMNAIYFKGAWTEPFKPESTQKRMFTGPDGSQAEHPMMQRFDSFSYAENEDFQAVALPYGKAAETEMLLFLPRKGQELNALIQKMTPSAWPGYLSQMHKREGQVVLPKFKLKSTVQLNSLMQELGMKTAFSETEARFEHLLAEDAPVFVSNIKQDAFIEVNEEGTEAAAVTTVTVGATSVQIPQNPFEMLLNRPFVYFIYDNKSNSILFMGTLQKPE